MIAFGLIQKWLRNNRKTIPIVSGWFKKKIATKNIGNFTSIGRCEQYGFSRIRIIVIEYETRSPFRKHFQMFRFHYEFQNKPVCMFLINYHYYCNQLNFRNSSNIIASINHKHSVNIISSAVRSVCTHYVIVLRLLLHEIHNLTNTMCRVCRRRVFFLRANENVLTNNVQKTKMCI